MLLKQVESMGDFPIFLKITKNSYKNNSQSNAFQEVVITRIILNCITAQYPKYSRPNIFQGIHFKFRNVNRQNKRCLDYSQI